MAVSIKPLHFVIAGITILSLVTPFARVYGTNVLFLLSLFGVSTYLSAVWLVAGWRDRGGTVVFMMDSARKSRFSTEISRLSSTDKTPGMATIPSGGYSVAAINTADRDVTVVPAASIEQLSEETTLVYSHATPLQHPRLLLSVASYAAKLATENEMSSFTMDKKSRSKAGWGLVNGLIMPITTELIQQQENIVNKSGIIADLIERGQIGEKSGMDQIRKMITTANKTTMVETLKRFVFGAQVRETDKPDQREAN